MLSRLLDGQTDMKVDLSDIKRTIDSVQEDLASFKVETTTALGDHDKRIMALETQLQDYKNKEEKRLEEERKASILKKLYDRRWNILSHGNPEGGENETKDDCVRIIKNTLKDALKIEDDIAIIDCHRLPQQEDDSHEHPFASTRSRKKYPRPIIFKVTNAFDAAKIWDNVTNLKDYNEEAKENGENTISFSKHLPKERLIYEGPAKVVRYCKQHQRKPTKK